MSAAEQRVEFAKAIFILELEGSVETVQREAQAAAAKRFTTAVASLRWNDPGVTNLVHTYVEIEMQHRHMAPLDVCKKLREWASTDYRTVPAPMPAEPRGTLGRKWVRAVAALGCGMFSPATPQEVLRALRPYQHAGAQPSARSIERLELHLTLEELQASLNAKRSLFDAFGLSLSGTRRSRHQRRHGSAKAGIVEAPACTGKPDLLSD